MSGRPDDSRVTVALLLALGALVAAGIAAVGPAVPERAVYTWPPAQLPNAKPTRALVRPSPRRPAECEVLRRQDSLRGAVGDAGGRGRACRSPRDRPRPGIETRPGGDVVTNDGATRVQIGRTVVADVPASRTAMCRLGVHLDGNSWSVRLPGGTDRRGAPSRPRRGSLDSSPSSISPPSPRSQCPCSRIRRTPTRARGRRCYASWRPRCSRPRSPMSSGRGLWKWGAYHGIASGDRPRRTGFVIGITAAWWLLAPLQVDDGWVRGRQVNSLVSGGFSNYYDDFGANLPLATWYEWIQHFVMTGTDSLGVHRLFSAVFVVATWFVARYCLVELTRRRPSLSDTTWWLSAAVFGGRRNRIRNDAPR